ncbi:hypothetical protein M413DRAFT_448280 [Hebeloma cylindrosporum]|uniref:Uncharacterized protein n=1 Tax=Hebeloma cylindrosporum TaxID=76867 RepID=A0A0C3C2C6_HEBCY|nr:hypothetical protein M413DRAFT_448280 [Hebeloma cylindrosporum h7]
MNTAALSLPVVSVQNTFTQVIQEVEDGLSPYDKFWVSCYKNSEPSIHAKVKAELDHLDRSLVHLKAVEGDVEISRDGTGNYAIACKPLGILPTQVLTPVQEYKDQERSNPTRPHRITSFDISPDCSRFATGYLDGSVFLYPTSAALEHPRKSFSSQEIDIAASRTPSKPHLSGVTSLRFFPSSRVLLTSGIDFSLTILPADLPDVPSRNGTRVAPVRTLRAHTRTVTDTAIIDLGRNIVSSSLDSTIKLWEVSSGEVISSFSTQSAVASMSLGDRLPVPPDGEESMPPPSRDTRETPQTSSKIVFSGLESGSFELFDLGFKKSVYRSQPASSSSLSSIAYSQPTNLLATGSSRGLVTLYDTRNLSTQLTSFSRLETVIEDIAFVQNGDNSVGLAIATSDGLPYVASVLPEGPMVSSELVGADCDPVRNLKARLNGNHMEVWSASDDGIVRRYVL